MLPDWIWFVFIFALGACIGSFLNVVIYRLPIGKSLVHPPSSCPSCNKKIRIYDNIPIISWLWLRGKCRYCKNRISAVYLVVEFLTGLLYLGIFLLLFYTDVRKIVIDDHTGQMAFLSGGWLVYIVFMVLFSGLIASSAIDLRLWVIPISICLLITFVGFAGSFIAPFLIEVKFIQGDHLLPLASPETGALSVGAVTGSIISLVFLNIGVFKQSYDIPEDLTQEQQDELESKISHRKEMVKEIVFLLPIVGLALASFLVLTKTPVRGMWVEFSQYPPVAGLLGSIFGYFIGCGVVWATRILGTLAFGKEAMGLGDVHLMGAAGAVCGPVLITVAFFVAPFFGLAWALVKMFYKKTSEIPYGPFLSLSVLTVIILHDWIFSYISFLYYQ